MNPLVSVIVPCLGQASELKRCLWGLKQQVINSPYEIIVVDSAADPSVAKVVADLPAVLLVRDRAKSPPGGARNLGARHARGHYLAFTDADCVPEQGWLAAAMSALKKGATVVGGPVLDAYPLHPIAAADNLLQFADFSPHRPNGVAAHFPGCNLALSQTAFNELGGFPNTPGGEDVLFTDAASKRWPSGVRFVRDMRVSHIGRTYLRAFWRHQAGFGFYRGRLGLRLRPIHQRLGSRAVMAVPIVFKRLVYIMSRTIKWNPLSLLRNVLLLPLLLLGLVAWARGFRSGCLAAKREAKWTHR